MPDAPLSLQQQLARIALRRRELLQLVRAAPGVETTLSELAATAACCASR